jgi:HD-like signal output (HDOD) protein
MIIGFKTLKGIIVAATLRQLNRDFGTVEKTVWENATATAIASQSIAQHLRAPFSEEAFLNGLLHDLGKLVLLKQIRDRYKVVLAGVLQGKRFHEEEERVLGFSHSLIGALVAQKWNFSQDICQVILHHHDPLPSPIDEEIYRKTAVVQAGNCLAHMLGFGHFETYPDMRAEYDHLMGELGINEDDRAKIVERVREKAVSSNQII